MYITGGTLIGVLADPLGQYNLPPSKQQQYM